MRRRNTESLGDVLRHYFKENQQLHQPLLEAQVQRLWREVLGNMVTEHTTRTSFRNGVLYVTMDSPILRSELSASRQRLIEKIHAQADSPMVNNIVTR